MKTRYDIILVAVIIVLQLSDYKSLATGTRYLHVVLSLTGEYRFTFWQRNRANYF